MGAMRPLDPEVPGNLPPSVPLSVAQVRLVVR